MALARAEQELEDVKKALREGKPYLGLTGSLLREYAVEAAKKENLLRKSQTATVDTPSSCAAEPVVRTNSATQTAEIDLSKLNSKGNGDMNDLAIVPGHSFA